MTKLLKFALGVDRISEQFGHVAAFGVMAAALISAGNAFIRYGFDLSSNGWLEIQWYLFAATVMLGAPLVLKLKGIRARDPQRDARRSSHQALCCNCSPSFLCLPFDNQRRTVPVGSTYVSAAFVLDAGFRRGGAFKLQRAIIRPCCVA